MIMVGAKRHGKTLKQMEFVSSILIRGTRAYSCVGFLTEKSRDFFLEYVTKKLKEEEIDYKQWEGDSNGLTERYDIPPLTLNVGKNEVTFVVVGD